MTTNASQPSACTQVRTELHAWGVWFDTLTPEQQAAYRRDFWREVFGDDDPEGGDAA